MLTSPKFVITDAPAAIAAAGTLPPVNEPPVVVTPPVAGDGSTDPSAPQFGLQFVPDIDFAVKDPALIVQEVLADYQTAFLTLTGIAKTLAPGDPVRLHLEVVCEWLSHQRVQIDFTGKNNLIKYAHDDYLDNIAALYGNRTIRLPASPAVTTLQFTLAAQLAFGVTIPKGTLCQAPNGIVFQTLVDGVIPSIATHCSVPAAATVAGIIGNGFAVGQINGVINWNQPYAVIVTNTVPTAGGSDKETDEQYRYRVWLAIESFSTCGPHDAYEFWALSAHPDIIQAVVYSDTTIAGEVWIYPLLTGGVIPTQPILDLVMVNCSANTRRPLTDWVQVFPPVQFLYTLNMSYYVESVNEVLLDTISANVTQAVSDWILWQRSYVSRDLNCDELIKRCLEAGAKRIVINSPSPIFQVMAYNQLACHDPNVAPVISFAGLEDA